MEIKEIDYVNSIAFQIHSIECENKGEKENYSNISQDRKTRYEIMAKFPIVAFSNKMFSKSLSTKFVKKTFSQIFPELRPLIDDIMKVSNEMLEAKDITILENINSLDDLQSVFKEKKIKGENVVFNFKGKLLFSCCDTIDTCYLKICGCTKQEYLEKVNFLVNGTEEPKISEWIKEGQNYIYPEKWSEWELCVKKCAGGFCQGLEIEDALNIIAKIHNGENLDKLAKKINEGDYVYSSLDVVASFSKKGPKLYRKVKGHDLSPVIEHWLEKIEDDNRYYALINKQPK